jgi:hypothetical protein
LEVRRSLFMTRLAMGSVAVCLVLQGCAKPEAPPPPPPPPPPAPHAGPPPAKLCVVAPFTVKDGGTADVHMTLSNEGGYCAATLTAGDGQPFAAGLVPVTPLHGIPRVVKYRGNTSVEKTSVEYSPQQGYKGHDSFIVKLIIRGQPGFTVLNMSVDVQ